MADGVGVRVTSVNGAVAVNVGVCVVGAAVGVGGKEQLSAGDDRVTVCVPGRESIQVSSSVCAPFTVLATNWRLLAGSIPLPVAPESDFQLKSTAKLLGLLTYQSRPVAVQV